MTDAFDDFDEALEALERGAGESADEGEENPAPEGEEAESGPEERVAWESCFDAEKIEIIEPYIGPMQKWIETKAGRDVDFPDFVYCMTEEEIAEGEKVGAGHGLAIYPDIVKVNPDMDPLHIALNHGHEILHLVFPQEAGESDDDYEARIDRLTLEMGRDVGLIAGDSEVVGADGDMPAEDVADNPGPEAALEIGEEAVAVDYCLECAVKHVSAGFKNMDEALDKAQVAGAGGESVLKKTRLAVDELVEIERHLKTEVGGELGVEFERLGAEARDIRKDMWDLGITKGAGTVEDVKSVKARMGRLREDLYTLAMSPDVVTPTAALCSKAPGESRGECIALARQFIDREISDSEFEEKFPKVGGQRVKVVEREGKRVTLEFEDGG